MSRRCPEQARGDVTFDPETGARGRALLTPGLGADLYVR